jgi:hypothetical protein
VADARDSIGKEARKGGKFSSAKKLNMHLKSLRMKFDKKKDHGMKRSDSSKVSNLRKGQYSGSFAIGSSFLSPKIESRNKDLVSNSFTAYKPNLSSQSPNTRKSFN